MFIKFKTKDILTKIIIEEFKTLKCIVCKDGFEIHVNDKVIAYNADSKTNMEIMRSIEYGIENLETSKILDISKMNLL